MNWHDEDTFLILLYLISQTLFVSFLAVCLCTGWFGGRKGKSGDRDSLTKQSKLEIRAVLGKRIYRIRELVSTLVVSRMRDGFLEFSQATEDAEKELFQVLATVKNEMTPDQQNSVFLKQIMKTHLMKTPFDLRGRRRLISVLVLFKSCQEHNKYTPGVANRMGRYISSCFVGVSCTAKRSNDSPAPHQIGWFTKTRISFTFILAPCALICLDMFWSDINVIVRLTSFLDAVEDSLEDGATYSKLIQTYENSLLYIHDDDEQLFDYAEDPLLIMCLLLCMIFLGSCYGLLQSPFLSCLRTAYHTALNMEDIDQEIAGTDIPLASVRRYDVSIDESSFESSLQMCMQLCLYLSIQIFVPVFELDSSFTFQSLRTSVVLGIISLTLGQVKVNKLESEYLTTLPQTMCYTLAAFASTISGQLQLTLFAVTWADVALLFIWQIRSYAGLMIMILGTVGVYFVLPYIRHKVIKQSLTGGSILTEEKKHTLSKFSVQALHLPASKARIGTSVATFYPSNECKELLHKENLVANLVLSSASLLFFTTSHLAFFFINSSTPLTFYSFNLRARWNFLLIASTLIPIGWIMSHLLVKLFYHLDSGALSSGPAFHFEILEGIEADKVERFNTVEDRENDPLNSSAVDVENSNKKLSKDEETGKCGDQSQDKDSMKKSASKECYYLKRWFRASVFFQEKGRWIIDNTDEEELEETI